VNSITYLTNLVGGPPSQEQPLQTAIGSSVCESVCWIHLRDYIKHKRLTEQQKCEDVVKTTRQFGLPLPKSL